MSLKSIYYFIIALVLAVLCHSSGVLEWVAQRYDYKFLSLNQFIIMILSFGLGIVVGWLKKTFETPKIKEVTKVKEEPKPKKVYNKKEPIVDEIAKEAASALVNLGYSRGIAIATIANIGTVDDLGKKKSVEVVIKQALKELAKK